MVEYSEVVMLTLKRMPDITKVHIDEDGDVIFTGPTVRDRTGTFCVFCDSDTRYIAVQFPNFYPLDDPAERFCALVAADQVNGETKNVKIIVSETRNQVSINSECFVLDRNKDFPIIIGRILSIMRQSIESFAARCGAMYRQYRNLCDTEPAAEPHVPAAEHVPQPQPMMPQPMQPQPMQPQQGMQPQMNMQPSMGMGMGMQPQMNMGMQPQMNMGMQPQMNMGMQPQMNMPQMGMGMGMGMQPQMGMGMGMQPQMGMHVPTVYAAPVPSAPEAVAPPPPPPPAPSAPAPTVDLNALRAALNSNDPAVRERVSQLLGIPL